MPLSVGDLVTIEDPFSRAPIYRVVCLRSDPVEMCEFCRQRLTIRMEGALDTYDDRSFKDYAWTVHLEVVWTVSHRGQATSVYLWEIYDPDPMLVLAMESQ